MDFLLLHCSCALEHFMSLSAVKSLIALFACAALISGCGGSHGSSAPPPVGGLTVEPGEGGATLTWTGVAGVDYWAYAGQSATICKNCSTNDWKSTVGAQSRGWQTLMSSPYFFTGVTGFNVNPLSSNVNNDVLYAFIMDGRINGGPGGDATTSKSTTPRLNGASWYTGGTLGAGSVTGLAFGPVLNTTTNTYAATGTYLALGAGGVKYQSPNGLSWSPITTSSDTTNWKGAAYAFPGTTIQKFVGVGAAGSVVYSPDLVTWTSAPTAVTVSAGKDLNAVASSINLLVAVGNNGTIVRSTDGITWVAANPLPSGPHLYAVAYTTVPSGNVWVAVGAGGALFVSADAATWSAVSSGTTQDLKGVASVVNTTYPNGIYDPKVAPTYSYSVVAVGNGGAVTQTKVDGGIWTWTARATPLGSGSNLNAVVASSALIPTNQFMVVGDGGQAFTSPDGVTWTSRTTTSAQNLTGLIRGYHNQYLAWAANGTTTYSK
jgi:hypothetical protein